MKGMLIWMKMLKRGSTFLWWYGDGCGYVGSGYPIEKSVWSTIDRGIQKLKRLFSIILAWCVLPLTFLQSVNGSNVSLQMFRSFEDLSAVILFTSKHLWAAKGRAARDTAASWSTLLDLAWLCQLDLSGAWRGGHWIRRRGRGGRVKRHQIRSFQGHRGRSTTCHVVVKHGRDQTWHDIACRIGHGALLLRIVRVIHTHGRGVTQRGRKQRLTMRVGVSDSEVIRGQQVRRGLLLLTV